MSILQILFYLSTFTALGKGLSYIANTIRSIGIFRGTHQWLTKNRFRHSEIADDFPSIIIALPVLREQAVLKQSLGFFSKLRYPKEKLKILVITTQKEIVEKKLNTKRLSILAKDLSRDLSGEQVLEKHLGLFPRNQLFQIIQKAGELNKNEVLPFLENEYQNTSTTVDLAREYCRQLNTKLGKKIFVHVHYPEKTGVMAHQLNFATQNLEKFIGRFNSKETFLGVYNADSNPNLDALFCLGCDYCCSKNNQPPKAYQQVAAYVKNFYQYPKTLRGHFLKASSLIQTRWGLGRELPMVRKHWEFWSKKETNIPLSIWQKIFKEPSAYCIGHGFFIRLDLLKEIGSFPTETLNEDLALGYYLCLKKIGIKPLLVLENVENPGTVSGLVKQKAAWYWGMVDYFDYWKTAPSKVANVDLLRRSKLAIQGLARDGLAWAMCSIFLAFMLLYPLLKPSFFNISLSILGLFVYGPLSTAVVLFYVPELFELSSSPCPEKKERGVDQILVSFLSLPYLLISSIGPWQTIYQKVIWGLKGKIPKKEKTER